MPIDFSAMPMHMVMPHAAATTCSATSFKDVCPSAFLPLRRVWDELNATFPSAMSGYLQNVGARDGFVDDPLYSLISERGVTGLAMEPDAKQFQALKKNMAPFSGMSLVNLPISPSNAGEVLAFPLKVQGRSMDIFKLDIDGCECHILEKLLALGESVWSHPKVIQIEINHLLPPPITGTCARAMHRDAQLFLMRATSTFGVAPCKQPMTSFGHMAIGSCSMTGLTQSSFTPDSSALSLTCRGSTRRACSPRTGMAGRGRTSIIAEYACTKRIEHGCST